MKKKIKWKYYEYRWKLNGMYKRLTKKNLLRTYKKYGKNKLVSAKDANALLKEKIESNQPFACCRFGMSELQYVLAYEKDLLWGTDSFSNQPEVIEMFQLHDNDERKGIKKFAQVMQEACENADFIGVWQSTFMGDYYVSNIKGVEKKVVASAVMVEPYYYEFPWSEALKGKRVLVINPFVETIESQYKNSKDKLFENRRVLPEFELLTLKSVWYDAAGKDDRFNNWFEVYEYLYEEAMKMDFDIVLLGCGPFGFPLASRFKMAGKQAIHIGGALQIMFGIIGQRWENIPEVKEFFNSYWTHPQKPNMGLNMSHLDNGCYW